MSPKKIFTYLIRHLLVKGANLKSVVIVGIIMQLVQTGRLVKMQVNGTGNLEFYQVVVGGNVTDMVLAVLEGKAKLIPEVSVDNVKDEKFTYNHGNFVTSIDEKTVCIEKLVMVKVTGQTLEQLMQLDVHHKWFRFCALPETIIMLEHDEHIESHKKLINYARNQVVYIGSMEDWDYFLFIVVYYRNVLHNNEFSIEY